jgi:hypothetical protein
MLRELSTHPVAVSELFKGFIILNLFALPLTAFLTFYITIMGASNPSKPGFFNTLGIVIIFIYGTQLGVLLWLIGFGKIFDVVLQFSPITIATVSWFSLILAAITFVVAGNIFVDHLYQFKQGNYSISLFALLITVGYVVIVYFAAQYFGQILGGIQK